MKFGIGIGLLCLAALLFAVLAYALHASRKQGDMTFGDYLTDTWEIIALTLAALLLGIVFVAKYR